MASAGTGKASTYEILLKILIIGDTGSKKTELLLKYASGGENEEDDFTPTVCNGLDYRLKDVTCRGKRIKLQLWDTAGQERFRSITSSYYRGSHGSVLVFNLQLETSFVGLNYWLDEIKNNAPGNFQTLLVAIGSSSPEEGTTAEVNLEMAKEFARSKQLPLVMVDLSNPSEVEAAFNTIVEKIMDNYGKKDDIGTDSILLNGLTNSDRRPRCTC